MSVTINRKSNTGFPLVLTSMTLNDLERRNSPYFSFFLRNSTDFQADYITVVEDKPIMFVNHCLPVPVLYFWQKTITHPAARCLCDSWGSCKKKLSCIRAILIESGRESLTLRYLLVHRRQRVSEKLPATTQEMKCIVEIHPRYTRLQYTSFRRLRRQVYSFAFKTVTALLSTRLSSMMLSTAIFSDWCSPVYSWIDCYVWHW